MVPSSPSTNGAINQPRDKAGKWSSSGVSLPPSHVIKAISSTSIPKEMVPVKLTEKGKKVKLTEKSPHDQLVTSGEGLAVLLKKSGGGLFNKHDVYGIKHSNPDGISKDEKGETYLNIRKGLSQDGRVKLLEIAGVTRLEEVSEAQVKVGVKKFHEKKLNPVALAAVASLPAPGSVPNGPVKSKWGNTDTIEYDQYNNKKVIAQVTTGALNDSTSPLPVKASKDWGNSLIGEEIEGIKQWKFSSTKFRKEVLAGTEPSLRTQAFLTALEKAPKVGDAITYRGLRGDPVLTEIIKQLEDGGPGSIFVDNAPHSMSINPGKAASFADHSGVLLKIYSKSGRLIQHGPGGYTHSGEGNEMEVVGMAGTKYRLISVETIDSVSQSGVLYGGNSVKKYVTLEEITDDVAAPPPSAPTPKVVKEPKKKKLNPAAQAIVESLPVQVPDTKGPPTSKWGNKDTVEFDINNNKKVLAQVMPGVFDDSISPLPVAESKSWGAALKGNERYCIVSWKDSSKKFRDEIMKLKPGQEPSSDVKGLLDALEKAPKVVDAVVYRGLRGGDEVEKLIATLEKGGPGSIYVDVAPHSMSVNPGKAGSFADDSGVLLKIYSKTGRLIQHGPGGYKESGYGNEMEVTGMPGTKYRLVSMEDVGSVSQSGMIYGGNIVKKYITLEEI